MPLARRVAGAGSAPRSRFGDNPGMKQLALGLALDVDPGLDDSVTGPNAELHAALKALVDGTAREPWIYLWGEEGSGRSHWLRAVRRDFAGTGRAAVMWPGANGEWPEGGLAAVDDVEELDPARQIALFNALIRARDGAFVMVLAGNAPPAQLKLRDDVRTRLGASLVYRVQPLRDEDKAAALRRLAAARGFDLPTEVADYLLTHGDRDLRALVRALDLLDRTSLERQRPLTVPLLREALREDGALRSAAGPSAPQEADRTPHA